MAKKISRLISYSEVKIINKKKINYVNLFDEYLYRYEIFLQHMSLNSRIITIGNNRIKKIDVRILQLVKIKFENILHLS